MTGRSSVPERDAVACPCGSAWPYARCCGRLHRGEARAATAEQLMRSRFSAFAVRDATYLLETWHPSTRPGRVRFDPGRRWVGLEVLRTQAGGMLDNEGTVEFVAHHERGGDRGELHEVSAFVRDGGHWRYVGPVDASLD